ncbi:MAG: hypothetical protein AAFX51_06420 [Cyanobacteria bacterium J06636_28]
MSKSQPSSSDISKSKKDTNLNSILDQIIRIKRQRQKIDSHKTITDSEREAVLETYRKLEELKNSLEGRVLLEYRQGLRTILEEVIL